MLQRIYGTAWQTQEQLDHYLWQIEEARQARPSQARPRARAVLLRRGRARPAVLAAQGAAHHPRARSAAAARARRARLPRDQHAVAGQVRPVEAVRALGLLRTGHVQARGRGRGVRLQADELPGVDAGLSLQDAQLSRPAAAPVADGPAAAQRALGHAQWSAARAPADDGRRAHLLSAGPGPGRDHGRARVSAGDLRRLRTASRRTT